ncbi:MAG TPA: hypothetical protein VFA43_00315 [Gemmatimonadaceae bacterium]|nr:hypothetical protein [Gemmatimonadaceae bacterium]
MMTVEVNLRRYRDGRPEPLRLLRWTTAASLIAAAPCQAQSAMSQMDMSNAPPATAADVRSMDAIMHAYYDVISGPAGNRDWNRFYSLFVPGGRLIQTDAPPRIALAYRGEDSPGVRPMDRSLYGEECAL